MRRHVEEALRALERIAHGWTALGDALRWEEDVLERYEVLQLQMEGWTRRHSPWLDVHVAMPKDVRAETADVLPILLSTKPLPEMEEKTRRNRTQRKKNNQGNSAGTMREKAKTVLLALEEARKKKEATQAEQKPNPRIAKQEVRKFFRGMDAAPTNQDEPSADEKRLVRALLLGEGLDPNQTQDRSK